MARSRLQQVLSGGRFAVTAELAPPRSASPDWLLRHVPNYREVDAVNFTDNVSAQVKMSSLASCVLALREGLEPVLQIACRDKNRLAIQSEVLGASALGIRNVLCITGDHQARGDHPTAKGVFDLDSIQAIRMVRRMRDERVLDNGAEIKHPPDVFIGGVANPFAQPLEYRPLRLMKKVKAGAEFVQTQAVFHIPIFREYMARVRNLGLDQQVYILAGVYVPKSARTLEYMRTSIAGMRIPEDLVKRMEGARDQEQEGLRIAAEMVSEIRAMEGVRGVHIMSVGWSEAVPLLIRECHLRPEGRSAEASMPVPQHL